MSKTVEASASCTKRVMQGCVVSDKMDKTIVVTVQRAYKHPVFGKTVRRNKKYKVHDEKGLACCGDVVKIEECAPISKTKHMRLLEVVRSA